jgi:hypothetical protein
MTTSTWTLTSGGNWASSFGWNTKIVPVAGDTANLTAALLGPYDVDVTDSESASVVNIGNVNATLVVEAGGELTANTINLTAGTLDDIAGGTIVGATIVVGPGTTFQAIDGTIVGTTWHGPLVLSTTVQASLLTVTDSLTLLNASGTGSGELDLTGIGADIDFSSSVTLDGLTGDAGLQINVTNSVANGPSSFLRVAQGATLTIGSHAHLDLSGPGNVTISNISVGGAFVNDGTITAEAGSSEIDLDSFTNAGTLIVNRTLLVNGAASNTGTVNVTSGTFHVTGALTGAGTTNLATGATVELGSTATGGTIHFGSGQSTLKIDSTTMPSDSITGFASGDVIDLVNQIATAISYSGTTATITFQGGGTKTVTLTGSFPGLALQTDHAGGTDIVLGPAPPPPPAPPPAGTTADMILRNTTGTYEIYDIGANAILAGYKLGQVGTDWGFTGLGGFNGTDTTDMLLRSASTGGFEVYDISNNNITNAAFLGNVGLNWQVMGFGNFSSMPRETDMILRNSNTGGVEVYDISNNQITGAAFMGAVGLNWQFSGVGNFSGLGESDMLLRNSNTGGLEVYDIANNQLTGAAFIGNVGVDWQFSGVGNFSSVPGETDLLLRNVNTGALEVYDINNNQLTGAAFIGTVGLDWQFAGIAAANGAGTSDLVLRNTNTGAFEVYDIANNQLTGAAPLGTVGLDWQLGGFAADPPTGSMGSSDGSTSQLVQAMAGFGGSGGAADGVNTVADTSQQTLLTTPQHV